MTQIKHYSLHSAMLDDHSTVNQQLMAGLDIYLDHDATHKSHHFFGRYENIYISSEHIPALSVIIETVKLHAASILGRLPDKLKAGLWFNVMNPGDQTTLHRHDDDDELLSAVYYVQVAQKSGTLQLIRDSVHTEITPKEGMFVFFSPDMPHEVTENRSQHCRVSLGINIGPV